MSLHADFVAELRKIFTGDVRVDLASRTLYSTDASIYQIEPLGVAFPRTQDDLQAAVELAAKYKVPILPRGSGTSLAGQSIGEALILDCSRWLDKIVGIYPDTKTAIVEPGVLLSTLNHAAARFGLQFGPDPASAERACMGGVIGNNATGAHSITYGMTADHILQSDVILSDGSLASFGEIDLSRQRMSIGNLYLNIISAALDIREKYSVEIKKRFPSTWRNSAGYRLNYLVPWSPTIPPNWDEDFYPPIKPGTINLAKLLAGSEGTLAVISKASVQLVDKPKHSILGILSYPSIAEACDAVPGLLRHHPSAIELIPELLIRLAKSIPAYALHSGWIAGDPAAVLVVEFCGDDVKRLRKSVENLHAGVQVVENAEDQARIWNVRKVGLGILDSRPQSARPVAFIEDCAIPVENLGVFVREIERLLDYYGAQAGIYAHASAGCLHIRPILDLKTSAGVAALREIAEQTLAITMRLGGSMSSEHGDGIVRAEWLKHAYGEELMAAMLSLKQTADPHELLNPKKQFDAPLMDTHLRYGPGYESSPWKSKLAFTANGGMAVAIEQCNGQGLCRKLDGTMCPSFQATREEMHSTRGRANLLRAFIAKSPLVTFPSLPVDSVLEALDLCLACKGCKAECPSGVDMAKLKFAFEAEYYKTHRRQIRDYLFGYFHLTAGVLSATAPVSNILLKNPYLKSIASKILGIAPQRPFPHFSRIRTHLKPHPGSRRVIFLSDAFTHYIEPQVEQAAFDILSDLGLDIDLLPIMGAGAAQLSNGFLDEARRHALLVLAALERLDPQGLLPIIGIEPPEVYTLKHDYCDLVPEMADKIQARLSNVWLFEEFIIRSKEFTRLRVAIKNKIPDGKFNKKILFHPHCHQRAEGLAVDGLSNGMHATIDLLKACGFKVELLETGCCGMAGTFGYEAEHYNLSMSVGELKLLPEVRRSLIENPNLKIVSSGSACRLQIHHGTGFEALHPLLIIRDVIIAK